MATVFSIDILDVNGDRLGDGPLNNVISIEDTHRLDAIGSLTFAMPASDERARYIHAGVSFDVYDSVDGYLGRFYYKSRNIDTRVEGGSQLIVTAHDQLIELARQSVHFRLTYGNEDVADVVSALVAMASGWSVVVDAGIGDTSVMYEGESVLRAVDVLRDRWNQHYRLGGNQILEFGTFGDTEDIVLRNLPGQVQIDIESNLNVAIVDTMRVLEEADEIFNKIIPLGAGQGVAQLTIEEATLGTYAVEEGFNVDGSSYWYIENAVSVSAYGQRERVLMLPQMRPITNSEANITNAANALKLSAEAYIARHLIPRVTYQINVRALRQELHVGNIVRLQYRDVVENFGFVDVDDYFYIMDITRRRHVGGQRSAQLVIASIAERRTADTDIMLEIISDVRALKINIPITLAYSPVGPYVQRIGSAHPAIFTIRIGEEVTYLNYAKMRFKTSPLKSSVTSVAAAGSSSVTSDDPSLTTTSTKNHTHSVTASGGHTHTLNVSSSGSHSHSLSITSSGLGSSAAGTAHNHEVTIHDYSPALGYELFYESFTNELNIDWGGGDITIPLTDAEELHTHSIDHGHSGSTAVADTHTHTGQTTDLQTHDHTIASSGSHDHDMPHTHEVNVSGHNHTLSYGLYEDTVYPQGIFISIDGTDQTIPLGGPWAPVPFTDSVEVEVDITEYLVDAVGGLRQNHRVQFTCEFGTQGEVEFECDMLCSIQPIAVS